MNLIRVLMKYWIYLKIVQLEKDIYLVFIDFRNKFIPVGEFLIERSIFCSSLLDKSSFESISFIIKLHCSFSSSPFTSSSSSTINNG